MLKGEPVGGSGTQLGGKRWEVVNQAIRAMEAINASSNKIAEIIGVIRRDRFSDQSAGAKRFG